MRYTYGITVQNKRSRISYKNRKLRANAKEKWNRVENTHEPIIDKNIFNKVQNMIITQKYCRNEKKHFFLLDGLIICHECKHKIGIRVKNNERIDMICNNYRRNSKLGLCTSHGFNYLKLEEMVLEYIKKLFLDINNNKIELNIKKGITKHDFGKMLLKLETEIKMINDNIDKMYVDKLNNKISEEMYNRLFSKLKKEVAQKKMEYEKLKDMQNNVAQDDTDKIKKIVRNFLKLEKPTPEFMKVIINRIELHQDKQVDIIFNFKKLNEIQTD